MQAAEQSITNIVRFEPAWQKAEQPLPIPRSPEAAILLALLSALSVGGATERRIFQLVGGELGRGRERSPYDLGIAAAMEIYRAIRAANHGR